MGSVYNIAVNLWIFVLSRFCNFIVCRALLIQFLCIPQQSQQVQELEIVLDERDEEILHMQNSLADTQNDKQVGKNPTIYYDMCCQLKDSSGCKNRLPGPLDIKDPPLHIRMAVFICPCVPGFWLFCFIKAVNTAKTPHKVSKMASTEVLNCT